MNRLMRALAHNLRDIQYLHKIMSVLSVDSNTMATMLRRLSSVDGSLRRRASVSSVDEEKEMPPLPVSFANNENERELSDLTLSTTPAPPTVSFADDKLSNVGGTVRTATSTDPSTKSVATASSLQRSVLPKYQTRRFTVIPRLPWSDEPSENRRRSSAFHLDLLLISKVRSNSSLVATMVPLLLILATCLIPVYCVPKITEGEYPSSEILLPLALAAITVIPATLFLGWCKQVFHNSLAMGGSGKEEESEKKSLLQCLKPSVEGICLPLAILFRQAQNTLPFYVDEGYQLLYSTLLNHAAAICTFVGWISLLDSVHGKLLAYAKRVDAIATANNQSQKWKSIMKSFSSCENEAKDEAYAIPGGHQSAARVLAEITGIYCNIGKILGATLLVFVFLGINLYSSLVALGLTVVFAGIVSALHINEAFKNVVSLVISNAVHVGEIISIGRSGFKPADNPGEFVTGFVESMTWTHIIIRDFKETNLHPTRRVWEAHVSQLESAANEACSLYPSDRTALSGGADRLAKLASFTTQWLKEHPSIDQEGYQKAVIKLTAEKGLVLEVIFFPTRGAKARQIRSEFVVMVLDAAKRFNLCLMPAEVRSSSPWPYAQDGDGSIEDDGYMNTVLEDLLPSPTLTKRAGYKPKNT